MRGIDYYILFSMVYIAGIEFDLYGVYCSVHSNKVSASGVFGTFRSRPDHTNLIRQNVVGIMWTLCAHDACPVIWNADILTLFLLWLLTEGLLVRAGPGVNVIWRWMTKPI